MSIHLSENGGLTPLSAYAWNGSSYDKIKEGWEWDGADWVLLFDSIDYPEWPVDDFVRANSLNSGGYWSNRNGWSQFAISNNTATSPDTSQTLYASKWGIGLPADEVEAIVVVGEVTNNGLLYLSLGQSADGNGVHMRLANNEIRLGIGAWSTTSRSNSIVVNAGDIVSVHRQRIGTNRWEIFAILGDSKYYVHDQYNESALAASGKGNRDLTLGMTNGATARSISTGPNNRMVTPMGIAANWKNKAKSNGWSTPPVNWGAYSGVPFTDNNGGTITIPEGWCRLTATVYINQARQIRLGHNQNGNITYRQNGTGDLNDVTIIWEGYTQAGSCWIDTNGYDSKSGDSFSLTVEPIRPRNE